MKVISDRTTSHLIESGILTRTKVKIPDGCIREKGAEPPNKRVKFDKSMFSARCKMTSWRSLPLSSWSSKRK